MLPQVKVGTYAGTGSAVTEATIGSLGFRPNYLVVWNETDGDERFEYISGLTAGSAYTILDTGVGTTNLATSATNYITVSATGFAVGTGMSENAKTYRYFAIGGYDPQ